MNIATAKEQIKNTVEAYLEKDSLGMPVLDVKNQRPIFLLGAPGIGKTAIMEQIAVELGIGIVSYSMTHHTRQSALGLPKIVHKTYDEFEYDASEYTMSEIIASIYEYMQQTGVTQGILFLDEINCVSETLYPSMLAFLQFKTFGRHKVPSGWVIVCAGNPPEYNRSVHKFDIVTLDRLRQIDVEPDYESWKTYALETGLHPAITTFLESKRDCFYKVESLPGGEKSFVTARGWEDLANIIAVHEKMNKPINRDLVGQFLHDSEIADKFATYYLLFDKYRSDYKIESILAGEWGVDIARRARNAEFDERIALIGLMLDSIANSCEDALAQENLALNLRDILRAAKQDFLDGKNVHDVLDNVIDERKRDISKMLAASNVSKGTILSSKNVVKQLTNMVTQCDLQQKQIGADAFDLINAIYRQIVEEVDTLATSADKKITNAFAFIDESLGSGREMLVFLAELASRQSTAMFIARFGCEAYYAHNDELDVDASAGNLAKKIAELHEGMSDDTFAGNTSVDVGSTNDGDIKTNADEISQSLDSHAHSHKIIKAADVKNYYDSKQVEFGFSSVCKMTIPAKSLEGKTVVDICCRRGMGVYKFSSKVGGTGKAIGIDWVDEYIEEAKAGESRAAADNGFAKSNMEFFVAYPEDLMAAGLGTNIADLVYVNNVANLFFDAESAFAEMYRVLKGGGMLVYDAVYANGERDKDVLQAAKDMGNSVQSALPKDSLLQMLFSVGFVDVEFLNPYDIEPSQGYKAGHTVSTVQTSESVEFVAACVQAYKPGN